MLVVVDVIGESLALLRAPNKPLVAILRRCVMMMNWRSRVDEGSNSCQFTYSFRYAIYHGC